MKKYLSLLLLLILVIAMISGCGEKKADSEVKVESGTIDQEYTGVVNPQVPKELKLSEEEEKDGVKKIPIKCGVEKEIPVDNSSQNQDSANNNTDEKGVNNEAKPKI